MNRSCASCPATPFVAVLLVVLAWSEALPAQVVRQPQRGRVATEMEADSVTSFSLRLGPAAIPAPSGAAFQDLGPGFGIQAAAALHFSSDLAAAVRLGWTSLADDLLPARGDLVDLALEVLWDRGGSGGRLEGGPVVGISWYDRSDLVEPALGVTGGVVIRGWRPVGRRWRLGLGVDVAWSVFTALATETDGPGAGLRSDGFRPGLALLLAYRR